MNPLAEGTEPHSRLLRCSLCIDESRAYWAHVDPAAPRASTTTAFAASWFGAKSEAWTTELLSNMRVRFDTFATALRVLASWRAMSPETRRVICHFHVQLTDPLYRAFTGELLPERRDSLRAELHRQTVIQWTAEHGPSRWALKTQLHFASRLLSCASTAGLLEGTREPRHITIPRVPDHALEYILYLLRALRFEGSIIQNPYLASLGLVGSALADRIRALRSIELRKSGDVHDLEWRYPDLAAWAAAELEPARPLSPQSTPPGSQATP